MILGTSGKRMIKDFMKKYIIYKMVKCRVIIHFLYTSFPISCIIL